MKVASVTVTGETADVTLRAVEAVLRDLKPLGAKAFVVDNDSHGGPTKQLGEQIKRRGWNDWVTVISAEACVSVGAGNNVAFRRALALEHPPEYFYLLHPGVTPDPGAVIALVEFMDAHPGVGLAGSRMRNEDGSRRPSAFRFPGVRAELEDALRPAESPSETGPIDWVGGASSMIRAQVLTEIGMFDEGFFGHFEQTDLCLRAARAGWPTYLVLESEAENVGPGLGVGSAPWLAARRYYLRKNHGPASLVAANTALVLGNALRRVFGRKER